MGALHACLHRAERPLTDDDLAWSRLVAKSRSEIYDTADGGVFAATIEADLPQGCVACGHPDPESENMAFSRPPLRQLCHPLPHVECQLDGSFGVIDARNWIVKDDHDPIPDKPL